MDYKNRVMNEEVREWVSDKLMSNVEEDESTGCINYTGFGSGGYGDIDIEWANEEVRKFFENYGARYRVRAHRAAWLLAGNKLSKTHNKVRHLCHNRTCINIEHLASGTDYDNYHDSVKAGRRVPKGKQPRTPKWEKEVIRDKLRSGMLVNRVAREHGKYYSVVKTYLDAMRRQGEQI